MTLYELGLEIANEGDWEEFYLKRHNYTMSDHHYSRRKRLEREFKQRRENGEKYEQSCSCCS
jgi:hypothetical protein